MEIDFHILMASEQKKSLLLEQIDLYIITPDYVFLKTPQLPNYSNDIVIYI